MKSMGYVVDTWAVPALLAPKAVAEAAAKFDELSAAYHETRAKHSRLAGSLQADIASANLKAAEARVEGKRPPALTSGKVRANLAEVEQDLAVLSSALDVAGDRLAQAVEAHRADWIPALEVGEREAEERLRKALEDARQAVTDLRQARSAPEWLRSFSLAEAERGEASQFAGGRALLVEPGDRLRFMDSSTDVERILDVAQLAVDPDPAPGSITTPANGQSPVVFEGVNS